MPQTYEVTAPNGKTLEITGDRVPTETELHDIFAKAGVETGTQTVQPPAAPAKPMMMLGRPVKPEVAAQIEAITKSEQQRTAQGAKLMPAAGGLVGGLLGGVPGAALGGAAGKAVEQTVLRGQGDTSVPSAPLDQAKDMGKSALVQGAAEGVGQGIVAGAGKLAKWLMNRATTRVTERLMRDFPNLSDTLIDNALTVSQGGYGRAVSLLNAAKAKATAALTKAEAAGANLPVELTPDLADSFKTAVLEHALKARRIPVAADAPLSLATKRLPPDLQELFAKVDAVADGGVFELSPKQADLFKSQLQKESRALYANRTAPNGQKAMQAEATLKAEFAAQLNTALDGMAEGYKSANAEAQTFIGASRGIKQAIRPNGNLLQAMVRPATGMMIGGGSGYAKEHSLSGAIAGAALGAAATSPRGMSMEAITLANPVMQQFLKQLPRATYDALMGALQAHSSPMQTSR